MKGEYKEFLAVAKENNIPPSLYRKRVKEQGWSCEKAATTKIKYKPRKDRDVAIYKGDTFIVFGSKSFVAKYMGKSVEEITKLCAPSIRKKAEQGSRLYGIYLDN